MTITHDQAHPDGTRQGPHLLGRSFAFLAGHVRGECQAAAARGEVTWALILLAQAFETLAETDPDKLLAGLDQTAAVTAAWRHDLARRIDAQKTGPCTLTLVPLDEGRPIDPCIVLGRHEVHESMEGRTWTNADARVEG
jgi:hypothetical protein